MSGQGQRNVICKQCILKVIIKKYIIGYRREGKEHGGYDSTREGRKGS
jgi:hypothetical protein